MDTATGGVSELTRDEREAVVYLLEKELTKMREAKETPTTRALWSGPMLQILYEQALSKIDTRAPAPTRSRTGRNARTAAQPNGVHAAHGGHSGGTGRRAERGSVS